MIFSEEKKLQIQMQKQRAEAYYECAVGWRREQISNLLGWYEKEIDSGRWYRQKRAFDWMEKSLDELDMQEAYFEKVLFNGSQQERTEGETMNGDVVE